MNAALRHLYLSSISNGEPIAGFIHRSQTGFNRSLVRELCKATGRPHAWKISWVLPSGLSLISEILGEATGGTTSMLIKNTLYPALSRFLPQKNVDMLETHHRFNPVRGGGTTLCCRMPNYSERVLSVCTKCLSEDLSSDGRSYWRREFMMPGIEFCWKHQEPLQVGCVTCILDYGKPESICYFGKNCVCDVRRQSRISTYSDDDIRGLVDLSFGFSRLLDPKILSKVGFDDFKSAIVNRSITLGLTRNGNLHQARILEFLEEKKVAYEKDKRMKLGISWDMLRKTLTGKGLPSNPIISIRLLSLLFGGWSNVENHLTNESSLSNQANSSSLISEGLRSDRHKKLRKRKRKPNVIREEYFSEGINAYRAARIRFPNENHTEILRHLPDKFRLLLSRKRLMEVGEPMPIQKKGDEYYTALDISLEKHIRSNRALLQSTSYRKRISKNILLKGHCMTSLWARIKVFLPLSRNAFLECEETHANYRRRKLKELVMEREKCAIDSVKLSSINTIDDAEVGRLLKKLRNKKFV